MMDGQNCLEISFLGSVGRVSPPGNNSTLWRLKCLYEPGVAILNPSPLSVSSLRGEAGNLSSGRT